MRVYMFPGQGSQHKGMGFNLLDRFSSKVEKCSQLMGYDLKDMCLNDPHGKLSDTQYTQPCLYLINCLHYLAIKEDKKEVPDYLCGHSLGEYSALFASNVFDLYTGFKMVKKRGELMSEIKNGSLTAVLGENIEKVIGLLQKEGLTQISAANLNTTGQLVIGGLEDDLILATELLEKRGYRCVQLNVSGAFHTHYMEPARIKFMRFLIDFKFNDPSIPVICSSTTEFFHPKYAIEILGFQITKSINWLKAIQKLQSLGASTFIELGPGEVLTKMTDKIIRTNGSTSDSL